MYRIFKGDAVRFAELRKKVSPKFHALFTDAPYHLTSIVERFGSDNSAPAKEGVFARSSKGFMGQEWDGGDIAFQIETWLAFKELLYPGAFGMSFASSRGWHRLAVAIEDAGFIIHPTIFGWCYGSGFPKATRVDTQIEDEELAKQWRSHRYGLQALKPALEPIIVFQKPYEGRPIQNITETGAGALNIDLGRIAGDKSWLETRLYSKGQFGGTAGKGTSGMEETPTVYQDGRWPSNFYLDSETAKLLDEQTGNLSTVGGPKRTNHDTGMFGIGQPGQVYYDEGGASRFFFQVSRNIDESDPIYYCAKASREERDEGLDSFQSKPIRESGNEWGKMSMWNGENGDEDWRKKNPNNPAKNPHPTVKPIDLCEYLCKLLLPPESYSPRNLFVPFSGVGSEIIGGLLAGWDYVEGVEITPEYIPIAKTRIDYWKSKPKQTDFFDLVPKAKKREVTYEDVEFRNMDMFSQSEDE